MPIRATIKKTYPITNISAFKNADQSAYCKTIMLPVVAAFEAAAVQANWSAKPTTEFTAFITAAGQAKLLPQPAANSSTPQATNITTDISTVIPAIGSAQEQTNLATLDSTLSTTYEATDIQSKYATDNAAFIAATWATYMPTNQSTNALAFFTAARKAECTTVQATYGTTLKISLASANYNTEP